MHFLKINKRAYILALAVSLALMVNASIMGSFNSTLVSIAIGFMATSIPIVAIAASSQFFLRRTSGISAHLVFWSFFIIVFVGCVMYLYFFFFPSGKASGLEFLLIPISQLMALPFAALLGVVLKNNARST